MSKPLSKKKASMLNMALMGAYQIVTALFGFVLPSMILNTYGASLHGYTTTVSNIMSYVALVNAGLALEQCKPYIRLLLKRTHID